MATLLLVTDWERNFENNRTRDMKAMSWVPVPVKLDGDGYTELMDHPDGAAHFGAWIAILEVAARCETRGTLLRGDRSGLRRPHDSASLSRITRIPPGTIETAIERLIDIGWLTTQSTDDATTSPSIPEPDAAPVDGPVPVDCGDPAGGCGEGAASRVRAVGNRTEGKGIEQKGREQEGERARGEPTPPDPDPGRKRGGRFDPSTVPIPQVLDVPSFREAWGRRLDERAEPGRSGSSPSKTSIEGQLEDLAKLAVARGVDVAAACVDRARKARHQTIVFPEDFEPPRRRRGGGRGDPPGPSTGSTGALAERARTWGQK